MSEELIKQAIKKALAKEFKECKVDENTSVSFRGKVVIELDIEVKRGPDVEYSPTSELKPILVLALALKLAGIQGPNIAKYVVEASNKILSGEVDSIEEILKITEEEIEKVQKSVVNKLLKKKRAGPTNVKGVIRLGKLIPHKPEEEDY